MARYFLELSYEGTRYSGFQVQEGQATIQSEVQRALEVLFRVPFALTGSSRTDAGVHAYQNFFQADTDLEITDKHRYNLNALLPSDIAVRGIYRVPDTAHCRFDAVSRTYRYVVYRQKDPFMVNKGWLLPYPIDWELMQEMAAILKEYQDFTAFSKRNTQVKTYICTIHRAVWREEAGGKWVFEISANRFLRGMIRGIVGTMVRIARSGLSRDACLNRFRGVIAGRDCRLADFSTPAAGLFLVAVAFEGAIQDAMQAG